jgi:uncharacterized protein (TIGR02246 family)
MCRSLVAIMLTVITLLGCKSASDSRQSTNRVDNESAKSAIIALNQQWEKHFEERDAAALANLFTDDCVRMPDGGATSNGKVALEAAYRKEFAEVWKMKFDAAIRTDEVVVLGDYAFARGRDSLIRYENDKAVQHFGKWMATYRRQPDGSWKYFWSTYNSNN